MDTGSIFEINEELQQLEKISTLLIFIAQGIEAESPQELRSNDEDLEWKARFFRPAGRKNAPEFIQIAVRNKEAGTV